MLTRRPLQTTLRTLLTRCDLRQTQPIVLSEMETGRVTLMGDSNDCKLHRGNGQLHNVLLNLMM